MARKMYAMNRTQFNIHRLCLGDRQKTSVIENVTSQHGYDGVASGVYEKNTRLNIEQPWTKYSQSSNWLVHDCLRDLQRLVNKKQITLVCFPGLVELIEMKEQMP